MHVQNHNLFLAFEMSIMVKKIARHKMRFELVNLIKIVYVSV